MNIRVQLLAKDAEGKEVVEPASSICLGELELLPREHLVRVSGQEVDLTSREFDMLMIMAEHPGWTYSAGQLAGDRGGSDYSPESVSVLVSRLRQKLGNAGVSAVVETVRGVGYRLASSAAECPTEARPAGTNHQLRDAVWQLQEAVIEVEHLGSPDQQRNVALVLEQARRAVYATLAEE